MSSYLGYYGGTVASASTSERIGFIRRTYAHLAGAIVAFVLLEILLFKLGFDRMFMRMLISTPMSIIGVIVLFVAAGFVAQAMARSGSRSTQYMGLGLYVVLEAIIFVPLMVFAQLKTGDVSLPIQAGILTLVVFGGLTAAVFMTKKDFSFLGHGLMMAGFLVLGLVICAVIFGFGLGIWFSALMIGLASAMILYDTSNVLHHYSTDQHVGASLELFASVATLYYYILRLLIQMQSSD